MNDYYNEILQRVESELDKFFRDEAAILRKNAGAGRNFDYVTDENLLRILQPGRDLLDRGGKRWRPVMMVLLAEALGTATEIVKLSSVVEIAHNGTLIIDDIEDKSDMRRGKPAVHKIYGEDVVINTGNLMYFLGLSAIEKCSLQIEAKGRYYEVYCRYMRRLHFGQGLDIYWHNNSDVIPEEDEYLQMCRLKTGSLAAMSAEFAAVSANNAASKGFKDIDSLGEKLGDAAEMMGVGFQIADDIKNISGKIAGKDAGDDIVEGKKSLPVIYFCRDYPEKKQELLQLFEEAGRDGIEKGSAAVEKAMLLLNSSGAAEAAWKKGRELLDKSYSIFEEALPECGQKAALLSMIDSFLKKSDADIDQKRR